MTISNKDLLILEHLNIIKIADLKYKESKNTPGLIRRMKVSAEYHETIANSVRTLSQVGYITTYDYTRWLFGMTDKLPAKIQQQMQFPISNEPV